MSRRTAAWLAWSLCAVCVVFITLALVLDFMTEELTFLEGGFRLSPGFAVLTGMLSLAYPTVGALIASRLPTHPVGWIFCGMGLLYTAQRFGTAYADYALLENFAFPGGEYVAWFSGLIDFSGLVLAGVFLMHNVRVVYSLSSRRRGIAIDELSRCAILALRSAAPRTGR
jgi:hypothetical protein